MDIDEAVLTSPPDWDEQHYIVYIATGEWFASYDGEAPYAAATRYKEALVNEYGWDEDAVAQGIMDALEDAGYGV